MSSNHPLWKDFCAMLNALEVDTLSNQQFYIAICKWLVDNRNRLKESLWIDNGLDQLTSLDPSLFNVELSESSVQEEIARLSTLTLSSQDSIAMIIGGILWDMVAFKTEVQCPNCTDDDLRALIDPSTETIVLCCDLCTWCQFEDGTEARKVVEPLVPANKKQLMKLAPQRILMAGFGRLEAVTISFSSTVDWRS